MSQKSLYSTRFFEFVTRWPKSFLILSLVFIGSMTSFMPSIVKDTSSDAFIADDDPVVIYRDHVRDIFGLEDPIIAAVVNDGPNGVFNPQSLDLVQQLTDAISEIPNVDPDRVISLATESNIVGTSDGMEVTDFFDPYPDNQERANQIRSAIDQFPLYQGSLVARDDSATLIVAELLEQDLAQRTYDDILNVVNHLDVPAGNEVHVAGEGAVSGYLATYIDRDATRLNPLAAVVITLVLVFAFRTFLGAFLPNIIVLGTLAASFGAMAAFGVSFYVITNGLATILIGIAVADSIHVMSQVYEEFADDPELVSNRAGRRVAAIRAMQRMFKPITLTTITTIAGFAGLWIGAEMPPMKYFGLFAAVGVAAAWIYSIFLLPVALTLFPLRMSPAFKAENKVDRYGEGLKRLGLLALSRPKSTIALTLLVSVFGAIGTSRVIVQEEQIENFQRDEPIYIADKEINQRMDGTYFLDIVVETNEIEGLFRPEHLIRIERLQNYVETLPAVQGSTSVADYIKQMHKAVNENNDDYYTIPEDQFLIAQLFLLYSASGDPDDFEEEIDTDYSQANVRFNLNVADYRLLTDIVPAVQRYVEEEFNTDEIRANLSGRVMVNYTWLNTIGDNHVSSLLLSLFFVWLAATAVFRSLVAGFMSLIPVVMALLLVYAVMGYANIWLGVGTSMFAAIAIGLGIDFSIHTLDRMKELTMNNYQSYDEAMANLFPSTGRALLFNFTALGLGFLVLTVSEVPPLIKFGLLVAVAVTASFTASMTVLPVLGKLLRPGFLMQQADQEGSPSPRKFLPNALSLIAFIVVLTFAINEYASASEAELPPAEELIALVNARDDGEQVTRNLRMELIDRRGSSRVRDTLGYRRYFGDEKRTVIFYTAPTNVRGTGFLTYDYAASDVDDDQWLYLPALRKVRRISASDRGDYFLGTDFTYEDIKKESKVAAEDYQFITIGSEDVEGNLTYVVEGIPISDEIAEELGYSRVLWRIDPEIAMSRKTEMWDTNGNALKTIHNVVIEEVQGIWTSLEIFVENHKTEHSTKFTFSNVDYEATVQDSLFEQRTLRRGR